MRRSIDAAGGLGRGVSSLMGALEFARDGSAAGDVVGSSAGETALIAGGAVGSSAREGADAVAVIATAPNAKISLQII